MSARAAAIAADAAPELIWFLEHPPLYTAGPRARPEHLLEPARLPVFETRRGGELTYHGPGQRVVYVQLDLKRRRPDVRAFVWALEEWIIRSVAAFGVVGERRADRVGVWVRRTDKNAPWREDKVAALGVQLKRWVSLHGFALNVEPDLADFTGILPCGVTEHGVTSLVDLGAPVSMTDVDIALRDSFDGVFRDPSAWRPRPSGAAAPSADQRGRAGAD